MRYPVIERRRKRKGNTTRKTTRRRYQTLSVLAALLIAQRVKRCVGSA